MSCMPLRAKVRSARIEVDWQMSSSMILLSRPEMLLWLDLSMVGQPHEPTYVSIAS